MNRCLLIGNLTADPMLQTTLSGVSRCRFTLAVNRRYGSQDGQRVADFIPVVAWRTQAENCARYLGKGSRVAVAGSLQIRSYTDSEDQRRTIAEVMADEVQFLSTMPSGETDTMMEALDDDEPFPI